MTRIPSNLDTRRKTNSVITRWSVVGFLLGSGALTGTSLLIFHLVVK